MADEETTAPATPPTAETVDTAQAPGERMFSHAELEAAVERARNAGAAEARRSFEGKQPKAKARSEDPKPAASQAADGPDLREQWFDLVEEFGLKKEQRDAMRPLFMALKPENPSAWMKGLISSFSPKGAATEPPTESTVQDKPAHGGGPVHPAVPAGTGTAERPVDVLKWGEEDLRRFIATHGKDPHNPYSPRNKEALDRVRTMARARLADTRIYVGPPKR